jgi:hypothetical protein
MPELALTPKLSVLSQVQATAVRWITGTFRTTPGGGAIAYAHPPSTSCGEGSNSCVAPHRLPPSASNPGGPPHGDGSGSPAGTVLGGDSVAWVIAGSVVGHGEGKLIPSQGWGRVIWLRISTQVTSCGFITSSLSLLKDSFLSFQKTDTFFIHSFIHW